MPTLTTKAILKRAASRNGRPAKRKRTGQRGFMRTEGYYGRYPPLGNELKFIDTTLSATSVSNSGTIAVSTLHPVVSGTGESQRIGRKIVLRSVFVRWVTELGNGTNPSATDDGLRFIVYHDMQCNGATAAVTDVLETANYLSFNNLANKNRFKILMDKFTDVHSAAAISTTFGEMAVTKSWYMKCNIPIEFSSTTGAISEIRSHNVGILLISDKSNVNCTGRIRVRYSDG